MLAPNVASLDAALAISTTDDLVRALLAAVAPYTEMFRDLAAFFTAAGAREGKTQWDIKIDDEHLDLKAFERFEAAWGKATVLIDVPCIDVDAGFQPIKLFDEHFPHLDCRPWDQNWWTTLSPALADWRATYAQDDYKAGRHTPLPPELHYARVPEDLRDLAALCAAILDVVAQNWGGSRVQMRTHTPADGHSYSPGAVPPDGLTASGVAQGELDYRLQGMVAALALALRVDPADQAAYAGHLQAAWAGYGRRTVNLRDGLGSLEKILSLPMWQRRNELYAAWIATHLAGAFAPHEVALHHEDGKIVFPFRKHAIATITDLDPVLELIGERRSPLKNPVGGKRKNNVQPDLGVWAGDTCLLVVEVKHYKKAARGPFEEVLKDYSRAHPDARVALVNYGPAGVLSLPPRCYQFGDLTPANRAQRAALDELVRDIVRLHADAPTPALRAAAAARRPLVVDVSASMRDVLRSPVFRQWFGRVTHEVSDQVLFVDDQLRASCAGVDAVATLEGLALGGSTDLRGVITTTLAKCDHLQVATDADGISQVQELLRRPVFPYEKPTELGDGLWTMSVFARSLRYA